MANPNIVTATSILGITTYLSLANTSATTLLSNASASGQLYKINSLVIANDDGSNSADITVSVHDAAAGAGTAYKIAHTIAVAADSTLVVIDKTSQIYLQENTSIVVTASAGGDLDAVCSYEIIS